MFVLQLATCALLTFFVSTVCAASVGLYAGTFDPLTQSEERIILCALGDTALSRECQKIGKEISRVVIFVNEDGEQDTFASTRERVLMVRKTLQAYGDRVEVLASTPAQTAERSRALLADPNVEQLFHIIGPGPLGGLDSIPADYHHKIVRVLFPLEHEGSALQATRSTTTRGQIISGVKEVIAKLGLYQPPGEDLAELQKSLFEEGWRDFLDDLNSACPDTMSQEICGALAAKWRSISIMTDDEATKMDRSELSEQNLLVYKQSQSEDRWAEKFVKTATKFLEGSNSYSKFRAVADDLAAKTVQGYPYGKLPHLRKVFVQPTLTVESSMRRRTNSYHSLLVTSYCVPGVPV